MLEFSESLVEIESNNHLVGRLFERTQASKVTTASRMSLDYASQYSHDINLFKHLAILGKKYKMEVKNGNF